MAKRNPKKVLGKKTPIVVSSDNLHTDWDIVLVEWIDAHGVSVEWTEVAEIKEPDHVMVYSMGYYLDANDKYIVLVPHFYPEGKHVKASICGEMTIPKSAIQKMTILKKKTKE